MKKTLQTPLCPACNERDSRIRELGVELQSLKEENDNLGQEIFDLHNAEATLESQVSELREALKYMKDQLFEKKWNGEEGVINVDFVGFDADGILKRTNAALSHTEP